MKDHLESSIFGDPGPARPRADRADGSAGASESSARARLGLAAPRRHGDPPPADAPAAGGRGCLASSPAASRPSPRRAAGRPRARRRCRRRRRPGPQADGHRLRREQTTPAPGTARSPSWCSRRRRGAPSGATLQSQGVVKSRKAFTEVAASDPQRRHPARHLRAAEADERRRRRFDILIDPANRIVTPRSPSPRGCGRPRS